MLTNIHDQIAIAVRMGAPIAIVCNPGDFFLTLSDLDDVPEGQCVPINVESSGFITSEGWYVERVGDDLVITVNHRSNAVLTTILRPNDYDALCMQSRLAFRSVLFDEAVRELFAYTEETRVNSVAMIRGDLFKKLLAI